jgi:hypothetical protein
MLCIARKVKVGLGTGGTGHWALGTGHWTISAVVQVICGFVVQGVLLVLTGSSADTLLVNLVQPS